MIASFHTTFHRLRRLGQVSYHAMADGLDRSILRARIRYLDPTRPRPSPIKVQVEATSKCNLRCPSCSRSFEAGGRNLTPEELRMILDRLPEPPASIILSGTGEPLVDPGFMTLVDILAERGIECTFFTNGTLLTAARAGEILARPNITYVAISCDGAQKERFEALRRGANFEGWKHRVGEFLNRVNGQSPRPLLVCAHSVLSRENLDDLEEIIRLCAGLGFHRLHFIDLIPVDEGSARLMLTDDQCAAIPQAKYRLLGQRLGMPVFFNVRNQPRKPLRNCRQPWEYIQVHPGGDVYPCFAIFGADKAQAMGNIFQEPGRCGSGK